ncbi:MAG: hypothetical protein ACUVR0_08495 [Candidatus Aminicenantales bacterium]
MEPEVGRFETGRAKPDLLRLLTFLIKKSFLFPGFLGQLSRQPLILLFLLTICFQLLLLTRIKFLYFVSFAFFYFLLLSLLKYLVDEISHRKNFLPLILVTFSLALRLPFLLSPRGLIFTSDNALDALQTEEIAAHHLPPFFLLGALQHMGTIKYMLASFLWKVFGSHYVLYSLTQVLMAAGMLFCFYLIFATPGRKPGLWQVLFLGIGFSFIETWFDNSLSLRGGSEFEMAFFFFLGAALLARALHSPFSFFLVFFFSSFSVYLHPLGLSFVTALAGTSFIIFFIERDTFVGRNRRGWHRPGWLSFLGASGALSGLLPLIYFQLFVPKPPKTGGWEKLTISFPSQISFDLVKSLYMKTKVCFLNLFNFEFNYLLDFFKERETGTWFIFLNRLIIFFSLLIFLLAVIIAVSRAVQFCQQKRPANEAWPALFWLFLSLAFVAKTLLAEPALLEPRHNFDLLIAIIFAYFISLPPLHRFFSHQIASFLSLKQGLKKVGSALIGAGLLLFLCGTIPHYYFYLKMTRHKEAVYRELLTSLYKNRVRFLATDFIIAYPIYFLSGRKILVSDSLGPLTIRQFFPRMREYVDKQPLQRKAFLFFAEEFPAQPWHKDATAVIKVRLFRDIQQAGLNYRRLKIKYFIIILPHRPG